MEESLLFLKRSSKQNTQTNSSPVGGLATYHGPSKSHWYLGRGGECLRTAGPGEFAGGKKLGRSRVEIDRGVLLKGVICSQTKMVDEIQENYTENAVRWLGCILDSCKVGFLVCFFGSWIIFWKTSVICLEFRIRCTRVDQLLTLGDGRHAWIGNPCNGYINKTLRMSLSPYHRESMGVWTWPHRWTCTLPSSFSALWLCIW